MSIKLIITAILSIFYLNIKAQTTPPSVTTSNRLTVSNEISSLNDTLTFTPFMDGSVITTEYLNNGVVFTGFNGSTDPIVFDYGNVFTNYGKILHSDNWYNSLRMNFVDTSNVNQYHLARRIEFDNVIGNGEVDYMSIDVYDTMNNLIYHYLSSSPEHVILNFATPIVAYITIGDSANTSYALDNILVDFEKVNSINEILSNDFRIYPNPFSSQTNLQSDIYLRNATLTVNNCFGQTVKQIKNISGQTVSLFRDNLSSGLYFLDLSENNKTLLEYKLVITDN